MQRLQDKRRFCSSDSSGSLSLSMWTQMMIMRNYSERQCAKLNEILRFAQNDTEAAMSP